MPEDIKQILEERGSRYGDFSQHALICQTLKSVMGATPGWRRLTPVQRHALEVIADKIARILNGDPNYADSWVDIIGYTQLVVDRLPKPEVNVPMDISFKADGGTPADLRDIVAERSSLD